MLKKPLWQKKRLEIMERDNWTCQRCCDQDSELQIHHFNYFKNPWEAGSEDLITLCKSCHSIIENQKDSKVKAIRKTNSVLKIMENKRGGVRRIDSLIVDALSNYEKSIECQN